MASARRQGTEPEKTVVRWLLDSDPSIRWQVERDLAGGAEEAVAAERSRVAVGAYFGEASDRLVDRLLGEQLQDGGWNCEAPPSERSSFNSTLCVLEGLLEYEKAKGATGAVRDARLRGQEYLLERKLFRSLSTGEVIDRDRKSGRDWREFSFPSRWQYDVLWGLDYLRKAGAGPDERAAEALDLVAGKRHRNGRWQLDTVHPGEVHFHLEDGAGEPSRWITLRALRVLSWFSARG